MPDVMPASVDVGVTSDASASSVAGGAASDGMSDLAFLDKTLESMAATPPVGEPAVEDGSIADETSTDDAINDAIADQPAPTAPVTNQPQADSQTQVDPAAPKQVDDAASESDVDVQSLSIAALNKAIATSPELKAALDKSPALRAQFFYNARLAERANKYDELFQTPQLANEIKRAAEEHFSDAEALSANPREFLQKLAVRSFERNADGSVKLDTLGRPVNDGSFNRAMDAYRYDWYGMVEQGIGGLRTANRTIVDPAGGPAISSDDLQEALRILQIATEGSSRLPAPGASIAQNGQQGAQSAPSQAAQSAAQLPAEVQAQLDELAALKRVQTESATQSFEGFKSAVETQSRSAVETDVRNLLAKRLPANAGFSDYMKDKIVSDTVAEIERVAKANAAHQSLMARALRAAPRDAAGLAKLVQQQQSFSKEILGRKLAEVLSRATPGVVAQNKQTQAKVTNQVNRREVQTSGGVASPSRPDVSRLASDIDQNARKAGKRLSDLELVDAVVSAQQRR